MFDEVQTVAMVNNRSLYSALFGITCELYLVAIFALKITLLTYCKKRAQQSAPTVEY